MKELLAKLRANIKIVIAALAALVVIICAVVVITQVVGSKSAQNTVTAVYKREGKSVVRIAGRSSLSTIPRRTILPAIRSMAEYSTV